MLLAGEKVTYALPVSPNGLAGMGIVPGVQYTVVECRAGRIRISDHGFVLPYEFDSYIFLRSIPPFYRDICDFTAV